MMKVDVQFLCVSIPLTRIFCEFFSFNFCSYARFYSQSKRTSSLHKSLNSNEMAMSITWRVWAGEFFSVLFFFGQLPTPLVMTQGYTPSPFFRLVIHPGNVTNFVRVSRKHTLKQAGSVLFVVFYNRPNCARTKGTIVLLLICWNLSSEVEFFYYFLGLIKFVRSVTHDICIGGK